MAAVNSLSNFGFQPATTATPKRILLAIEGHRGKGKSHQALTAPAPIAYFNLDLGLAGVVSKFAGNKVIMVNDFQMHHDQVEAQKEWQRFTVAWMAALKAKDIRTVVIDTESNTWELVRLAMLGQLTQVMPYQYTAVNAAYSKLLREVVYTDKNLILLRHLKPVYINDKRQKDYEAAGFSGVDKLVDIVAETWRDDVSDGGEWNLTITKNRLNPDLDGETLSGEMASFPWLAQMSVEGSDLEDWQ